MFQTVNSVILNHLSLKCQTFTSSGCKDIGISKFEVVAKTEFPRLYSRKKTLYTCFVNTDMKVTNVSSLAEMKLNEGKNSQN